MALTADEKRAHAGEMLRLAIQHQYVDMPLDFWVKAAKKYKAQASYGTAAERKEAMQAFVEHVAEHGFGRDPNDGIVSDPTSDRHWYINHYVESEEPGEGTEY